MATDNPISYSDFIRPDDSVTALIAQLEKLGATYDAQIKKLGEDAVKTEASIKSLTSTTTEGQEAIKKGAYDFIVKPPDLNRLLITVRNAIDS